MNEKEQLAFIAKAKDEAQAAAQIAFDQFKTDYKEIAEEALKGLISGEELKIQLEALEKKTGERPVEEITEIKTSLDSINKTLLEVDKTQKEQGRALLNTAKQEEIGRAHV